MKTLHLKIITPERVLFDEKIKQVSVPTPDGEVTVLPDHIPVISLVEAGEVKIVNEKNTEVPLVISGGFTEINGDRVLILADTAERVEEIDLQRAQEAEQRARDMLKEKSVDSQDYALLMAKIQKQLSRVNIAKKYKK